MSEEQGVIELGKKELDPNDEKAYRERILAARASRNVPADAIKGKEMVGTLPKPKLPPLVQQIAQQQVAPFTEQGGIQPRPQGSPVLRDETAQQLAGLAEASKKAADEANRKVEDQKKEKADEENVEDILGAFDFGGMSEADRVLNNKKRRQDIEARCAPMSLEDLLYKNEVRQKVPVVPGKFEPTFRTYTPEESLFLKKFLGDEAGDNNTQAYVQEKLVLCQLCCGLVALNDTLMPDHLDESGTPTRELFNKKLKVILKKSSYITADLCINYAWFDIRVRKLLNPDAVKNG